MPREPSSLSLYIRAADHQDHQVECNGVVLIQVHWNSRTTDGFCTALSLADESKCSEPATSANGLFCSLHARQVQGLYNGYKRRNAQLVALNAAPPLYLAAAEVALRNDDFSDVNEADELRLLEQHLFEKYRLLDRVIRARKTHHAHFYAQTMDYGHKQYVCVKPSVTQTIASERDCV